MALGTDFRRLDNTDGNRDSNWQGGQDAGHLLRSRSKGPRTSCRHGGCSRIGRPPAPSAGTHSPGHRRTDGAGHRAAWPRFARNRKRRHCVCNWK